ncbi:MAG: cupin domain-containing protein [Sphingobium sp.]
MALDDLPGGRVLLADHVNLSIWLQTLDVAEETVGHWHEIVTDTFTVVRGEVAVDRRSGGCVVLAEGSSHGVPPGVRHRLRNTGSAQAVVVTVQTGGRRDFNVEQDQK